MIIPTKTYKPFQLEDIQAMRACGNCICGHECGVGKTAIAIGLITGRTLIIVPKKALHQFKDEIQAFRPELNVLVVSGTPKARKEVYTTSYGLQNTTLLLTYDTLRGDIELIAKLNPKFQTILFDEAHKLASTTTKTHKGIRRMLKYYQSLNIPRPTIHGFTASLIMNSPMDIYGVYNILRPNLFPNYMYFVQDYMFKHPTMGYLLGARQSELPKLGKIIAPYYIRRTLEEVCPQMPPHIDEIIHYELSPAETKLYKLIRQELLLEIDPEHIDLIKNPMSIQTGLTKLQKLSELTDSADLIGHSGIPSTKLELLKDKVDEVLAGNNRKLIIYSWFARRLMPFILPLMEDYNPTFIVGGMDSEANRIKFKTDPTCRVLILSSAGSEALSFEEASYLIRLDTPFSLGKNTQLAGRIRRQTTIEPTFSYTLVAKGTVDENMLKILAKKKSINNAVFDIDDIKELLE